MQITRNPNGYTISAMVRGSLESETYIGFSKLEAINLFRRKFGI